MSYEELIKNDLQLQYARNAVRYYKSNTVPEFLEKDPHKKSVIQRLSDTVNSQASSVNVSRNSTPAPSLGSMSTAGSASANTTSNGPGGNVRRHIISVDDSLKINYEMVKNVPGNFPSRIGIRTPDEMDMHEEELQDKLALENEANTVKTKIYKQKLFDDNDTVLELVGTQLSHFQDPHTPSDQSKPRLSLREQLECLQKIQDNLLQDYKDSQKEEKKWFVLKELLLEANTELDLFSSQDYPNKVINLGDGATTSQHSDTALVFNRNKRQKLSNGSYSSIF